MQGLSHRNKTFEWLLLCLSIGQWIALIDRKCISFIDENSWLIKCTRIALDCCLCWQQFILTIAYARRTVSSLTLINHNSDVGHPPIFTFLCVRYGQTAEAGRNSNVRALYMSAVWCGEMASGYSASMPSPLPTNSIAHSQPSDHHQPRPSYSLEIWIGVGRCRHIAAFISVVWFDATRTHAHKHALTTAVIFY